MGDYDRGRHEGYFIGQLVGLVLGVITMGATILILEYMGGPF